MKMKTCLIDRGLRLAARLRAAANVERCPVRRAVLLGREGRVLKMMLRLDV